MSMARCLFGSATAALEPSCTHAKSVPGACPEWLWFTPTPTPTTKTTFDLDGYILWTSSDRGLCVWLCLLLLLHS
jgi:hypothetical protein